MTPNSSTHVHDCDPHPHDDTRTQKTRMRHPHHVHRHAKGDVPDMYDITNSEGLSLSDPAVRRLKQASVHFNRWLTYGQAVALVAIAIAALAGIGQEVWGMIEAKTISLGELLMLFLFVEIIAMVKGASLGVREIPLHTPIALAIVAVARYIVVDVEHIHPDYMIFTSLSILVLVLALWVVRRIGISFSSLHRSK